MRRMLVLVLAAVVVLGACGTSDETAAPATTTSGGGWDCPGGECDWSGSASEFDDGGDAMIATAEASDRAAGLPMTGGPPSTVARPDTELVTAGSIDDNEAWEQYLLYRQWFDALAPRPAVRDLAVEGRQVIEVTHADGRPVLGALVEVAAADGTVLGRSRTYADGRTLFHAPTEADPRSQQRPTFTATVSLGGASETLQLDPEQRTHRVVLDAAEAEGTRLDVLFLVDATGSMGDEIDRLKANMVSIAEQVEALSAGSDTRYALTVYRDHGDLFVTRTFDFTGDVAAFTAALREVEADGGGDWPEALEEGLHDAVHQPAWRGEDTVKLVFLVADAPPHLREEGPSYLESLDAATDRGIKIFSIAASGLADDPQGEYIFRQFAQVTMGRFVFLTYGADGIGPGEETPHQVDRDRYDVLALDELVVRLVTDELAHRQR